MSLVQTPKDVQKLGTILGVWAHPDDESFVAAGLLAAAVQNGQRVVLVTATKGEGGVRDENRWPRADLGNIRAEELDEALAILGVTEHRWLGYVDGQCKTIDLKEAVGQIQDVISEVQPDTVVTFGPDGLTGHPDHKCVSRWATMAVADTDIALYYVVEETGRYEKYLKMLDERFNMYFNIDKPPLRSADECDIALSLSDGLFAKKRDALFAMPSQYEGMLDQLPGETLKAIMDLECFVRAK